jgi:hypothetical protein
VGVAVKETIGQFLNNIKNWPDVIQRNAQTIFDSQTVFAKSESQRLSPVDTGELNEKITMIKAKRTPNGIVSGYMFTARNGDYYYPAVMNRGTWDNGKEIKFNKRINSNAQSQFAEKGIDSVKDNLMDDMVKLVTEVFIKS